MPTAVGELNPTLEWMAQTERVMAELVARDRQKAQQIAAQADEIAALKQANAAKQEQSLADRMLADLVHLVACSIRDPRMT